MRIKERSLLLLLLLYLAHALALQVGSYIIGFAIAAGMFVCDGTHSTYNYFILF